MEERKTENETIYLHPRINKHGIYKIYSRAVIRWVSADLKTMSNSAI